MQITIVVEDKTVICDGVAVPLPDVDWSVFDGDPSTKWDDVAAVQFNTDTGQGHVEYRTIITSSPMRSLAISRSPSDTSFSSMRSIAASRLSVVTGRLRNASIMLA